MHELSEIYESGGATASKQITPVEQKLGRAITTPTAYLCALCCKVLNVCMTEWTKRGQGARRTGTDTAQLVGIEDATH